jgi:hypothetical protein
VGFWKIVLYYRQRCTACELIISLQLKRGACTT